MEEQKLYSVILSEKEFGLLSWLDRKWTNFKNWRNRMTARANNAFVNFIGLGNTRVGRGLKGLNNARADIRNNMNEAGYNLRGTILGYKDQDNNMEERQYSILDPRYFSRKDYEGLPEFVEKKVRKRRNDLAKQLWEDRKYLNSPEFQNSAKGKNILSNKKTIDLGDFYRSGYNITTKRKKGESDKDFILRHKNRILNEKMEASDILKDAIRIDSEKYKELKKENTGKARIPIEPDSKPKVNHRPKQKTKSITKQVEGWISKHPKKTALIGVGTIGTAAGSVYASKKIKDHKEKALRKKLENLKDLEILPGI